MRKLYLIIGLFLLAVVLSGCSYNLGAPYRRICLQSGECYITNNVQSDYGTTFFEVTDENGIKKQIVPKETFTVEYIE